MSNEVKQAELEQATNAPSGNPILEGNLDLIQDVEVKLHSTLGEATISVSELMDLKKGSVVALNTQLNQPLSLYLKDKLIARGSLVAVDDSFGIEITELA